RPRRSAHCTWGRVSLCTSAFDQCPPSRSSGRRLFLIVGIESFTALYPQTALLDIPLEQLTRFSGNAWTDGCVMLFNVQHYIEANFVHPSERSERTEDALKKLVDDLRR